MVYIYIMFLNPSLTINNVTSNVNLTTQNNELYENGIRVATQTDVDFLQQEIDNIPGGNPNALITDTPLVIPTQGAVFISDGLTSTHTNPTEDLIIRDYDGIDVYKQLNCNGGLNIQSLTTVACTMTSGTNDFTINNGQGSRTVFINSSSYDFDNTIKIGSTGSNLQLLLNGNEITPSSGSLSAGMLRALNINQIVPTVAQTYNIVWSNLTAGEQLLWKGGDAATADPIASATGNYWSFVKTSGTSKINWTPPIDLSSLSFQDLQSMWAIIRINTTTGNLATEGSLWFQIQSSNNPANPPAYRTRWNYSNAANPNSQTGYFIKLFALDTIPLSTSATNTGKGQETTQLKFKTNPCDVEPTLFSLGLSKFVVSPSGDQTSGYTLAPVQSVGINTASNILAYNFDVIAFGVNSYRWNLFFA